MPIWLSLTVIIGVLAITTVLSFMLSPKEQTQIEEEIGDRIDPEDSTPSVL